jgi:hypothetical protein
MTEANFITMNAGIRSQSAHKQNSHQLRSRRASRLIVDSDANYRELNVRIVDQKTHMKIAIRSMFPERHYTLS